MSAINKINVNGVTYDILGLPVGTIFTSALPQTNSGVHLLDGSTIATNGVYSDFCKLVKKLVEDGYNLLCSEEEFKNDVELTGSCGKFVLNEENRILRLPKITTFVQGLSDLTNIGKAVEAGLPNITGKFTQTDSHVGTYNADAYGALYMTGESRSYMYDRIDKKSAMQDVGDLGFDASRSSEIYGNSDTVQPPSVTYPYYIVLATVKQTDIEVDINNITNDLNQLSNQVINIENSLLNKIKRYATETWQSSDGLSWYTLYSDGWKECGISIDSVNQDTTTTINLPISFSDTNYFVLLQAKGGKRGSTQYTNGQSVNTRNISSLIITSDDYSYGRFIYCCGY